MTVAVQQSPAKHKLSSLLETAYSGHLTKDNIDRENGIIKGVKLLGRVSKNGREYSEHALSQAVTLYENKKINIGHPDRNTPDKERGLSEWWGVVRNVHRGEDGDVYGDIHYRQQHAETPALLEAAEKFPEHFGLSQNAEGQKTRQGSKIIVETIDLVRSLDVVTNPATTNGLFESEERTVKKTIKQIFESLDAAKFKGKPGAMKLLEDDGAAYGNAPMDIPEEASVDDQVDSAFRAMACAVIDDDSLDDKAKVAKIKDILAAKAKLTSGAEDKAVDDEPGDETSMESTDPAVQKLSKKLSLLVESFKEIKTERDGLKAESHARSLLESAKRSVTPVTIAAVTACKDYVSRKALIESWPQVSERPARPRQSAPLIESADTAPEVPTGEKFIAQLKRR